MNIRKAIEDVEEFNKKFDCGKYKKSIDTVLSLIKENQIETEIYKEELDSIYKALDIERGVARPRTEEIIQALKNTIKSQSKQIDLMAKAFKQDDVRTVEEIKQYFADLVKRSR